METVEVYPARDWNKLAARLRRAWPMPGRDARLRYGTNKAGVEIAATAVESFSHPWQLRCFYEFLPPEVATFDGEGQWRAHVEPGFVNGRDAFIAMPYDWPEAAYASAETKDVPLTNDPPPYLVLDGWRNPVEPGALSATAEGELVYGAGEGYPKFFEALGVRPASKGGANPEVDYDETRTREIRACDIVLVKPRLGAALAVEILDLAAAQTHSLGVTFQGDVFASRGGRSTLYATPKFKPLADNTTGTPFLGIPLNVADPQFDELLIATVYMVSPPGAGSSASPDNTWEAYPSNSAGRLEEPAGVFWNLCHATSLTLPVVPPTPVKFNGAGLGLGALDFLANSLLGPLNAGIDEALAFLQSANLRGRFWTT